MIGDVLQHVQSNFDINDIMSFKSNFASNIYIYSLPDNNQTLK